VTFSPDAARSDFASRLLIVALSLAAVGIMAALAGWLLSGGAPPAPAPRNPFGVGPREAAPAATGIGGLILGWQAAFYRELSGALRLVRDSGAAVWTLAWLGFAYGAFHAAGPGHGKAVISAYILADERSAVMRGFGLSLAAALFQAAVAIAIVGVFTLALRATAASMNAATRWIELASFAAVMLVGLAVLWAKAGVLLAALRGDPAACGPGCDHTIAPPAAPPRSLAQTAGVVMAAGARPCAGAIIILVFAASQNLLWAGVAATFAMALGVALTTGALGLLAVMAKRLALALAAGRGDRAAVVIRALECGAAAAIACLGALLLLGLWSSSIPS
jgi:ABC-type nickel/cobalt efflux system permease component RcnA